MAQIDNIDKIAFSTQFPIDKIVGYYEGSFAIAGDPGAFFDDGVTATTTITHGLGYRPMLDTIWSIDGTNYRPSGVEIITDVGNLAGNPNTYDALYLLDSSSTTNIIIRGYSVDQTARTIYYKTWLLYPDD